LANGEIFTPQFLITLEGLVRSHHSTYNEIPPQGIYFEYLVEKAFRLNRIPFMRVQPTTRNVPRHDLAVGNVRFSIKTETGEGTKQNFITITKLLTTERDPWEAAALIDRAMQHLARTISPMRFNPLPACRSSGWLVKITRRSTVGSCRPTHRTSKLRSGYLPRRKKGFSGNF
jgi:hypothetical protein